MSERDFITKAIERYYRRIKDHGTDEHSNRILDDIRKLDFSDTREFRLSEEKYPIVSIFVETDKNAKNTRKKIERVLTKEQGFKKREKLLEMRKELNRSKRVKP